MSRSSRRAVRTAARALGLAGTLLLHACTTGRGAVTAERNMPHAGAPTSANGQSRAQPPAADAPPRAELAAESGVARPRSESARTADSHRLGRPYTAELRGLDYAISLDESLRRASVELCLHGAPPARLVYGSQSSIAFLRDPRLVSEAGQRLPASRPLRVAGGEIELAGVKPEACLTYRLDLGAALADSRSLVAYPAEHAVVTSTELFLWRPPRRPSGLVARVRFVLPAGVQVSVPWPEDNGTFLLDETAFSFTGHAIFGKFSRRDLPVPSSTISLVSPAGFSEAQRSFIANWISNAGNVVSLATGRFPVPRAQVIVLPTGGFRFGHTGRSGGASIVLFLPDDVGLESLRADWIAIHEFSHLVHPFVQREDAWLSEGLATYLQEVLRVRAGMLRADDAWRRLYEGAALGRDAEGNLSSETQRMAYEGNYRTVYWAGAAIALMIDVELRRRSAGKESLDSALAGISRRPEFMQRPASAISLLAALDETVGGRTCQDVAHRYLEGHHLPDLADLYRQLGLLDATGSTPRDRELRLTRRSDVPLAWVRDAIMAVAEERANSPLFGG